MRNDDGTSVPTGAHKNMTSQPPTAAKKPWWKRTWVIALAVFVALAIIGAAINGDDEAPQAVESPEATNAATFEPEPVTDECRNALAEAEAQYEAMSADDDATIEDLDALELPPLTACGTATQWLSAMQEATGTADPWELYARCSTLGYDTPVCEDARDRGLIEQ